MPSAGLVRWNLAPSCARGLPDGSEFEADLHMYLLRCAPTRRGLRHHLTHTLENPFALSSTNTCTAER